MMLPLNDQRVNKIEPLLPPSVLKKSIASNTVVDNLVLRSRAAIRDILSGNSNRLLIVIGPCSIHDPAAALDYAHRLAGLSHTLKDSLCIVMRAYFEKARTSIGWQGFINDPHLDNSFDFKHGLRQARQLLIDINSLGLPVATEFLDPLIAPYIADLISWGAIGARTCESQIHRNFVTGLSMPIGIKNSTTGNIKAAIDGIKVATRPHRFLSINDEGLASMIHTKGNPDTHIILRGGTETGPNYHPADLQHASTSLLASQLRPNIMIDCNHGNSQKIHDQQTVVLDNIQQQIKSGNRHIIGIMLESFLVGGNQAHTTLPNLTYGQSITDACIDWDTTESVLCQLAQTQSNILNTAKSEHTL